MRAFIPFQALVKSLLYVSLLLTIFTGSSFAIPQTAKIIDGTRVPASDFPHVAVIWPGDALCTGTLISPHHIITAAHCFYGKSSRTVGDTDTQIRFSFGKYRSTKVFIHPTFRAEGIPCGERKIDAAIIQLDREVTDVSPVPLLRSPPVPGQNLTLVGYGYEGSGRNGQNDRFPPAGYVNVGSTVTEFISSTYAGWVFNPGESNSAGGDSGGPAFYSDNGVTKLHSLVCGGEGEAEWNTESYNTRIDIIAEWLDSVVESFSPAPPELVGFDSLELEQGSLVDLPLQFKKTIPTKVSADGLPPGLRLVNYRLNGVPERTGTFNTKLTFNSPYGDGNADLQIIVKEFPSALSLNKATLKLSGNARRDMLKVSGKIRVPARFRAARASVAVQVLGYQKVCRMNRSGKCGTGEYFNFKNLKKPLALKRKNLKFELKLNKKDFLSELAKHGFSPADETADGQQRALSLKVRINHIDSTAEKTLIFKKASRKWVLLR